jgi:hypothetical protein
MMIRVFMKHKSDAEGRETSFDIPRPADQSKIILTGQSLHDPAGFGAFGSEIDLTRSKLPCHRKGFITTRAMVFQPGSYSSSIARTRLGSKQVFRLNVTFASGQVILIHIPRCIPSSAIAPDGKIADLTAVDFLNRANDLVTRAQVVVAEITFFGMTRINAGFTTCSTRRLHSQHEIKAIDTPQSGLLFVKECKVRINALLVELKSLSVEDRAFIKSQL